MGVLNVTPDSFSDGGRYADPQAAVDHALAMAAAGADLIDIGGESTRPGATAPGVDRELERVIPVIERLRRRSNVLLSVDTSEPDVMAAAAAAGVDLINDVRALTVPGALDAARVAGLPVCLMHMQGAPSDMQQAPAYIDVVAEVESFLLGRVAACVAAGLPRASLILDPGFGFGKTVAHNLALLRALPRLAGHGLPLMVGLSRKSLISALVAPQVPGPDQRLGGSVALALTARTAGARIVRVHDVAETAQAFRVMEALADRTSRDE
jgi:dihydropteroate synthase